MSWRGTGAALTGTNDVPIANRRRFGPTLDDPSAAGPPNGSSHGYSDRGRQEHRSPPPPAADPNAPKKRKSRFGEARPEIPGVALPTAIDVQGMSVKDLSNYTINLRIEEINRKLRLNDVVPPERERSPSPPPTYDAQGRRTNTRDIRYRRKLENERIVLVERAMKNDPHFQAPAEYHQQKRTHRPQDKVYIPVKEFPEINFFGLLVGPRGNSLKKMERESGAKISIRGKGSVKEGKGRPDAFADDAEEDLHCLIMAETQDKVASCVALINRVIETAASTPEGENDHKRNQLRELAALNGTLRDDENQICQNCGNRGHRKYDCPEQKNFNAGVICRVCGSAGHIARDCTKRDPNGFAGAAGSPGAPDGPPGGVPGAPGFDSEYANLMAELGESGRSGVAGGGGAPIGAILGADGQPSIGRTGPSVPPWRDPNIWNQPGPGAGGQRPPMGGQGYGGPQGGYGSGGGGMYGAQNQGYYPQQAAAAQGYGQPQQQYGQPAFDQNAAYAQYYQSLGQR